MKPNFKKDIKNVFFKEFAEKINFCGIRISAVVTNRIAEGMLYGRVGREHDNYYTQYDKKVSYRTRDLPQIVKVRDIVEINDIAYEVTKLWERQGITNILITRVED